MTKRILALLMAAVMVFAFAACAGDTNTDTNNPSAATPDTNTPDVDTPDTNTPDAVTYNIGICQLVQHDALDAATQGFKDALTEKLGDRVKFEEQNASGDSNNCAVICNGFAADGVDLILANATAALQAAVTATNTIPVLGTSITDYATALDIDDWTGTVGGNVSGTSDLAPLDQQAAMLNEIFPDAEKVGVIFCSGEPNSLYQANTIKGFLEGYGYTVRFYTFADSNDVTTVTETACAESDVIYIPTDNTAASCTEAINNVAFNAQVPIVAGEEGICVGCGAVTLSISYYDIGYATGEMAYEILENGADISTMPVTFAPIATKKYNEANCTALGVAVPADYVAIG